MTIVVSKETWDWLMEYLNGEQNPLEVIARAQRMKEDKEAYERIENASYEFSRKRSEEAMRVKQASYDY